MARSLWITTSDVFKNTGLQADIDNDKIIPFIERAQDVKMQDLLGSRLYKRLDDLVYNGGQDPRVQPNIYEDGTGDGTPNDFTNYFNLLYNPSEDFDIRRCLEQWTAYYFLKYGQYTISEKGVFKFSATEGTPATDTEVKRLRDHLRGDAEWYQSRLYDYLCQFSGNFPEYTTTLAEDLPPSYRPYSFPWL